MRLKKGLRTRQMHEIVTGACRLIDSPQGVKSVHIVARGRPTYTEMRRYQQEARNNHVRLTVDGSGVITVRPDAAAED